jgi:predicted O-methyltransferase YrrM
MKQLMPHHSPYSSFRLLRNYLSYYRKASNGRGHGMHSPFVFEFIRKVLHNANGYTPPPAIEERRRALLKDERLLAINDLGAGSRMNSAPQKQVRSIARSALKSTRLARVLYRLACHYQPQYIVELGTSLGITTAYLAAAAPDAGIITVEGSPAVAAVAREGFGQLGLKRIELKEGNFDSLLPGIIQSLPRIDLAYIDGNHRYGPTMDYFHQLLAAAQPQTILVFDDIHWSAEMEKAWAEICAHEAVAYTIDLFFLGFVFFRKDFRVKQNFTIRF